MQKYFLKKNKNGACAAKLQRSGGFTIIETMISIAIFLVVVIYGMGALLNAYAIHQRSADTRSIMDSLNFMMDDMSRSLRTGDSYICASNSCVGTKGISFTASDGTRISYLFNGTNLEKTMGSGVPSVVLNPPEVKLDLSSSGFTVTGAAKGTLDNMQPYVTIVLNGTIATKGGGNIPFNLQTSVSQRLIDNQP